MKLILLCTIISFVSSFPALPPAFSVDIEANLQELAQTRNLREYYSATKMARYEVNNADSSTTRFVDFAKNIVFTLVNGLQCTPSPYTPVSPFELTGNESFEDLMSFATKYPQQTTYGFNNSIVRGIPCDLWTTTFEVVVNASTVNNNTGYSLSATVNYYFTVGDWKFVAMNVTNKPVRIEVNATRTYTNGSASTTLFHSHELINFIPAEPLSALFILPAVCSTPVGNVITILQSNEGKGLAAGMFFLGAFIGAAIACVSIWGYCRRRQMQREKFQRSAMEMTRMDQ
jgi:hypothetical protein